MFEVIEIISDISRVNWSILNKFEFLEFKSFALWCFECELLDCNLIVKESD
jgi:hypothetical protein